MKNLKTCLSFYSALAFIFTPFVLARVEVTGDAPDHYQPVTISAAQNSLNSLKEMMATGQFGPDAAIQNAAVYVHHDTLEGTVAPVLKGSHSTPHPDLSNPIHNPPVPSYCDPTGLYCVVKNFIKGPNGLSIQIKNGSSDPQYKFTSTDIQTIVNELALLPPADLAGIHYIESEPLYSTDPVTGQRYGPCQLSADGTSLIVGLNPLKTRYAATSLFVPGYNLYLAVGQNVWNHLSAQDQEDWLSLDPKTPADVVAGNFAQIYDEYTIGTGTTFDFAIRNQAFGQDTLSEIIDMASHFVLPSANVLFYGSYLGTDSTNYVEYSAVAPVPLSLTDTALTFGQYTFALQNGQVVSASFGGTTYPFEPPVTIPASIWARFQNSAASTLN
jgi:hypothetical protein